MQATQLTTYTRGDLMISSPDEAVVLKLATLALGVNPVPETIAAPAIGEYWAGQGGVYAGLVRGEGELPDYHLIVATQDVGKHEWGGYGAEVAGAGSASDGAANTQALIADEAHPAATACSEYEADGHKDFYLPARRELQVAEANTSDLFAKEWYWSSSQRSAYSAFGMGFAVGTQDSSGKLYGLRVRPVRRLPIH